jgi:hypothetical protein
LRPAAGDRERRGRLIDPHHGAGRAHHLRQHEGDMAGARAEVEHAHARLDARGAQQEARGRADGRGLLIEPLELVSIAPEHVGRPGVVHRRQPYRGGLH